ncbi:hypothetical protein [Roseateles depolymerans]|uniref:hypothetical protein n=1 Tax=Roseateles depolymerans TaxID=76731 RepID=UPI000E3AA372|nr:hypothetical protein [Roseateles depolymerans]REG22399.1 hypothetical protein DES44_1547 [Roseateles depolymerans]
MKRIFLAFWLWFHALSAMAAKSPCDDVDRSLSAVDARRLSLSVSTQLAMDGSDVQESFQFRGWWILYTETHQSDEVYLFYKNDPSASRYVGLWSGIARPEETLQIEKWTKKNVIGIPSVLAKCFAWHMTKHKNS